ncbi:MAG TPA: tetratricopeptide repeat protein [Tepidisphaeraceae bacterium]
MNSGKASSSISHLWQVPAFLASVALFVYAAYRFIAPHFLTPKEKLDVAAAFLTADRPEAAIDQVNALIAAGTLHGELEGEGHLLIAKSLEQVQIAHHYSLALNEANIVEESHSALKLGVAPTGEIYRRIAQSYESLHQPADALANYRLAIKIEPKLELNYGKKLIELQIAANDPAAQQSLNNYLNQAELSPSEKAWGYDQKAQLQIANGDLNGASKTLQTGLLLNAPPSMLGPLNYRMGFIQWKQKENSGAERSLRLARDQLGVEHPLDANAACLLGKILSERQDNREAAAFFQSVLTSHPESEVAPLALLGRANCRLALGQDDAGLSDLHDLTQQFLAKPAPEIHDEVVDGIRRAERALSDRANYADTIECIGYEQQLTPHPAAEFFARLGVYFERRAQQINQSLADANDAQHASRMVQISEFRAKAGDAYLAYSRALTLKDDAGYGDALWKAIDLYDQAGDIQRTISALETFVNERPDDALTPTALLRLGRAYQAGGQFDKAIDTFTRNQFRYPNTLAASKSAVPLAQSYIAKGPDNFPKAENVLRSVLENNPLLTPKAEEFKQALFELGQLYYRTGRYEEAVGRLQEWTERYPTNPQMAQVLFLMADSYRKSALLLDAQIAAAPATSTTQPAPDIAEETAAHRSRLTKAKQFYDRLVDWYRDKTPDSDVDALQLKLAHFYRADCVYDLGDYAEAVKLYDEAAFRYQDDPSALAAYVQIVNAYVAMGKTQEAKAANERAKWLLRRMPPDAFSDNGLGMPRKYWDQWLAWTSNSGMWK